MSTFVMAVVWKNTINGDLYEVRNAGKTLRLYTNGVFHTQYNPEQPLTGHVWDLLMLPAFFYPQHKIKRVLVLGVGGGAVIQMLRHFVKPDVIVGVELNPVHLTIARHFFNLKGEGLYLYQDDAVNWIKNYKGEKFDLIIEDLFTEKYGEPASVVDANGVWFNQLLKNLSKEGAIVRNFIDLQELKTCAALKTKTMNKRFDSIFQLTTKFNENFVGVFVRAKVTGQQLRKRLMETPGLNPGLKTSRLRYQLRSLK
ncbi:MAG: hypothetical protein OEY87_06675 [Gammaproteobacteria bacterium]|nr:hypothetical protein [Gammaproteobacteria bacterium]